MGGKLIRYGDIEREWGDSITTTAFYDDGGAGRADMLRAKYDLYKFIEANRGKPLAEVVDRLMELIEREYEAQKEFNSYD